MSVSLIFARTPHPQTEAMKGTRTGPMPPRFTAGNWKPGANSPDAALPFSTTAAVRALSTSKEASSMRAQIRAQLQTEKDSKEQKETAPGAASRPTAASAAKQNLTGVGESELLRTEHIATLEMLSAAERENKRLRQALAEARSSTQPEKPTTGVISVCAFGIRRLSADCRLRRSCSGSSS